LARVQPFAVQCPTCKARFKVRDASASGQILHCPRCTSMLEVKAPPGWQPDAPDAGEGAKAGAEQSPTAVSPDASTVETLADAAARGSSGEIGSTFDDPKLLDKIAAAAGDSKAPGTAAPKSALPDKPAVAPNSVDGTVPSGSRRGRLALTGAALAIVALLVVLFGAGIWWFTGGESATPVATQPAGGDQPPDGKSPASSTVLDEKVMPAAELVVVRFESALDWRTADPVLALLPAEVAFLTDLPAWVAWRRDRRLAEMRMARLGAGLVEFIAAEQGFPVLAAGSNSLPPESRLSWIAQVLPYYGHADWQRELNSGRGWRDPPNDAITRRVLPELLNPALGFSAKVDGRGACHFVGITGLGSDSATLDVEDPKAGVFGATRRATLAQIGDGAANTIAMLGVTERIGAWGSGGSSTTRALTAAPYVNGPDGFGTGQVDGMFAVMADGSVRWISADADPRVIEQMATINGGEQVQLASLDPSKPPPVPEGKQPPVEGDPTAAPPSESAPATDSTVASEHDVKLPDDPVPPREPGVREVDVAARLADRVAAIEIPRVSLAKFANFVTRLTTVPCVLDLEALAAAGQNAQATVAAKLAKVSVDELLKQTLAEHELIARPIEVNVPGGKTPQHLLLITRTDVGRLVERRVPAADLISEPKSPGADDSATDKNAAGFKSLDELGVWIQQIVSPSSWQATGGRGTLTVDGNDLAIKQTPDVQSEVAALLKRWRAARKAPAARLQHGDKLAAAWAWPAALDAPQTVTFFDDARLADVLEYLAERSGLSVVVNWRAVAAAGWGPDVRAGVRARDLPLSDVLAALLAPLGLDYRAIDEQTIEITSRAALAARPLVEFYPLANLVSAERPLASMLVQIKKLIVTPADGAATDKPAAAVVPGPTPVSAPQVRFDEPSGYAIVAAPAGMQRDVARLVRTWAKPAE
jgi:hypothetical protein